MIQEITAMPPRYLAFGFVLAGVLIAPPALAGTVQVTVSDLQYVPAEMTAKVGDTVVWTNKDAVEHSATVKGGWDVEMKPGKSGRVVLKKPGTFDYYCRYHPNMKGQITVQPK